MKWEKGVSHPSKSFCPTSTRRSGVEVWGGFGGGLNARPTPPFGVEGGDPNCVCVGLTHDLASTD